MQYSPTELREACTSAHAKTMECADLLNRLSPYSSVMAGMMIGVLVRYFMKNRQNKETFHHLIDKVWGSSSMKPGESV
jgi:hypothetical protein